LADGSFVLIPTPMLHLNHPHTLQQRKRKELDDILPIIMERARPKLNRQLASFGLQEENMEAACYQLYDQHGIDPLLKVHPLRESFFQMELSDGSFQNFTKTPQHQPTAKKKPVQVKSKKKHQDYIKISKDSLLLFMAITLVILLILQLVPKQ